MQLPGKSIEYVVDASNRWVGKKVNGQLVQGWVYQGKLKPVAELDANGQLVARFVYGTKANIPDYILKNGNTYRVIADHLGSPRLVVDIQTGAVVQSMDFDSFGQVMLDSNPSFQPFGFAGGLYDSDTKLLRFGARDYEAESGRWTAKDPINFSGGSANIYNYVDGDPVNWIDLTGFQACPPHVQAFFNDLRGPLSELASRLNIDENIILALSAHESGWYNDHNRGINNPFGLTKAGGKNLHFDSVDDAINYWESTFGDQVRGATDIDDFIKKLLGPPRRYNSVDDKYGDKLKDVYKSVLKFKKRCFPEK